MPSLELFQRLVPCIWAAAALLLAGCATPAERFDREARQFGFERTFLAGDGFRHVVWLAGLEGAGDSLHVYIEHDGTPWLAGSRVSDDPTPRTPVALELMARDAGARLFLGRPCYFETRNDAGCSSVVWTRRRYAPEVVLSMAAALRRFLALHPFEHVVLIGYSGGGTLAWLVASHVPETSAVVTIAANLDTDAWAIQHDYTALAGSLNPALQPSLRTSIREVHFAGDRDENVPPAIAHAFGARHPHATIIDVPQFDHRCCWIEQWPELLAMSGLHTRR